MRSRLSRLAVAQYYADGEDAFAMRKPLSRAERGRAAKADAQREAAALLAAELRRTLGSGSRVKRADVAEALDAFYGAASGRAARVLAHLPFDKKGVADARKLLAAAGKLDGELFADDADGAGDAAGDAAAGDAPPADSIDANLD